MRGSHLLNDQFFEEHSTDKKAEWGAVPDDWHGFSEEEVGWFEKRGCEVVKVCCEPGDLVVWDSRTVHYNVLPEGEQKRAVICKFPFFPSTSLNPNHFLPDKARELLTERKTHATHPPPSQQKRT